MINEHEMTLAGPDACSNGIVRRLVSSYRLLLRDRIFWPPANNNHMPGTIQITRGASFATLSLVGHRDRPKYRPLGSHSA
ncbi:hypothetical protein N7536_004743 [Penicillium majusculum]|nr:hypothetical protein N7536_004743 [Penicillium majusculum]